MEGGSIFQIVEADGRNGDCIAMVQEKGEKGIKMSDGW